MIIVGETAVWKRCFVEERGEEGERGFVCLVHHQSMLVVDTKWLCACRAFTQKR